MRTSVIRASMILALAAASARASAQSVPTPTPMAAEEHVTVPSLPGEENKEGTVQPDGRLTTGPEGFVQNNPQPVPLMPTAPSPAASPAPPPRRGGEASPNILSLRGVVRAYVPGRTLTLALSGTRRLVTYRLAAGAEVPADLKRGDSVRLDTGVDGGAARKKRPVDRVVRLRSK